jgi:hypothetical protein
MRRHRSSPWLEEPVKPVTEEAQLPLDFDGATYEPALDQERLSSQLRRVKILMNDGKWRTLSAIARCVGGSEAGVSARLRDFRKDRFGALTVERRRIAGGLYEYRLIQPMMGG